VCTLLCSKHDAIFQNAEQSYCVSAVCVSFCFFSQFPEKQQSPVLVLLRAYIATLSSELWLSVNVSYTGCGCRFYPLSFSSNISPMTESFLRKFLRLLYVHICEKLQNCILLSLALTTLCHINHDRPVNLHVTRKMRKIAISDGM